MATKSVIEIELIDDKFQEFVAIFEKYKNALKEMPSDWQEINQKINEQADIAVESFNEINKKQSGIRDSEEKTFNQRQKHLKDIEKKNSDVAKQEKDRNKELKKTALITAGIAATIIGITYESAKWLAMGSVTGFGLGGIASGVSDYRRQAQGFGVTTGDLRSAGVNLGKYLNPESTIANIADIQGDLSRRGVLGRLGGHQGQTPADMLPDLMRNAVKQFNFGGKTNQYAEAMGLTQVFSLEELRRLSSLTQKELNDTINQFAEDRKKLAVDDADSKAWQDFFVQIKRSGHLIETSFIKGLAGLTPQLEQLSKTISVSISDFLGSDQVKKAIENFGDYLASPQFKKDLSDFGDGLHVIADGILWLANFLPKKEVPKTPLEKIAGSKGLPFTMQMAQVAAHAINHWINPVSNTTNNQVNEQKLTALEKSYGLPAGIMDKLWSAESGRGQNMLSKAGAMGHFQFMPDTAKQYDLSDPNNFNESSDAAARKMTDLMRQYKGNVPDAIAAYNWGEGNLNHFLHGDKGYSDKKGYHDTSKLPKETGDYLGKFGIQVNVNNASGGNLIVTSNAMK